MANIQKEFLLNFSVEETNERVSDFNIMEKNAFINFNTKKLKKIKSIIYNLKYEIKFLAYRS